jgi:hypothetical protein
MKQAPLAGVREKLPLSAQPSLPQKTLAAAAPALRHRNGFPVSGHSGIKKMLKSIPPWRCTLNKLEE